MDYELISYVLSVIILQDIEVFGFFPEPGSSRMSAVPRDVQCRWKYWNTDTVITDTDPSLSTVTSLSVLISTSVATDTDFSVNIGDVYNPDIGVHWSTDTLGDTAIVSHTDFTDISVRWNTDTLMLASIDFNL